MSTLLGYPVELFIRIGRHAYAVDDFMKFQERDGHVEIDLDSVLKVIREQATKPPATVTVQMCEGCGRVSMGRSPKERCPDTDQMERQISVEYRL